MNQSQRSRPTKAPMRGRSRPPMGSSSNPQEIQQQNYNQQQQQQQRPPRGNRNIRGNRGNNRGGRGGFRQPQPPQYQHQQYQQSPPHQRPPVQQQPEQQQAQRNYGGGNYQYQTMTQSQSHVNPQSNPMNNQNQPIQATQMQQVLPMQQAPMQQAPMQQAPINIHQPPQQQQPQPEQQGQGQAHGQPKKQRSRPPVKTQNTAMFAQFNAPKTQPQPPQYQQPHQHQHQHQHPHQQLHPHQHQPVQVQAPAHVQVIPQVIPQANEEPVRIPSPPQAPQVPQIQKLPQVQVVEPEEVIIPETKAPEAKAEKKEPPVVKKPVKRQPPWLEFTGMDKSPPILYGWAHRVRQVLSADTLRIALLKPRSLDADNALLPPEILQITLDGIMAPRCQRWDPNNRNDNTQSERNKKNNKKNNKKQKKDGTENKEKADKDPEKEKGSEKGTEAADKDKDKEKSKKANQNQQPTEDEPYAFEAREFVREKVLNKNVFYALWRSNNASGGSYKSVRYWGDIYYQESQQTKSLSTELIANGFADLKSQTRTDLHGKELERLHKKKQEAKDAKLHIYADEKQRQKHVRNVEWIAWNKQPEFGEHYRGKTLRGIVDQVISGSTIRVELVINKHRNEYRNVVVNIAGINCPKVPPAYPPRTRGKGKKNKKMQQTDTLNRKFGVKSREWTEERLLGQIVDVKILFVSAKQIMAQIFHEKGRIAPSLLKKGLAQYEGWTAKACDAEEQQLLLAASDQAKAQKRNIWNEIAPDAKKEGGVEQMVMVTAVISGDTIKVVDVATKKVEERYTLSSIRAPRLGTRGGFPKEQNKKRFDDDSKGGKTGESADKQRQQRRKRESTYDAKYATPDEYLARDAKEMVRQCVMGKTVRLVCEYTRDAQFNKKQTVKKFASVYYMNAQSGKEENVALQLVKKGYAELVWHSKNDDRSADFLLLQEAHKKARLKKIGLNAFLKVDKMRNNALVPDEYKRKQKAKESAIMDYSGIAKDIKDYQLIALNQYLMSGRVNGVIEFVFGANRVKVYIPSKRICIAVRLADIRCGGYSLDSKQKTDPNREAAKAFLNSTILQRDIELQITSTGSTQPPNRRYNRGNKKQQGQRNPNLDGHIYLAGKNISEYLLEYGWASLITRKYDSSGGRRSSVPATFKAFEKIARDAKLGIWQSFLEGGDDNKRNDAENRQRRLRSKTGQELEVVVSHIESATSFFVNDNGNAMRDMGAEMEKLAATNPTPPAQVRRGRAASVRYAVKYAGYYARAAVLSRDKESEEAKWFVEFVDYGNKASVVRESFAELPAHLRLDRVPRLAQRCVLAGVSVYRKNNKAYYDAGNFFAGHAFSGGDGTKMRMKVMFDELYSRVWYVELFVGTESINELIAREGFVTLDKDRDLPNAFRNKFEYGEAWGAGHVESVQQYFANIKAGIALAKDAHRNIWYHGDVDSADDDNLYLPSSMGKKKGGKRR